MLIIVLSIFVFVFPLNGVTLWKWLDIMVLPAAVVFLAFVLNEAVTQRESARDRQNAENEYRKNFLMSVMRAYNGAKKVRRVLKAHRSNDMIPCTVYEAQMETLMDSQLELELYKREEVTMQPNVLLPAFEDKKRKEISDRVSELETYLKNIIRDYDRGDKGRYAEVKKALALKGPSSQILLKSLPKLWRFVETTPFKQNFAMPIHALANQVKEEVERAHNNGAN